MASSVFRSLALVALLSLLFQSAFSQGVPFQHLLPLRRRAELPFSLPTTLRGGSSGGQSCQSALSSCLSNLATGKTCSTLPVPPQSRLPLVPPGTFRLSKLRSDVYLYDDGAYLSLILLRGTRLALIDFPDSGGSNTPNGTMTLLTDATEQVLGGKKPSRIDMVYSHSHYDHIGAGTRFLNYAKGKFPKVPVKIWGTKNTRDAIRRSKSKRAPEPTVFVDEMGSTLNLGRGLKVIMKIVVGHTSSDLLLYIPKNKGKPSIAMMVDVIFPRWAPFSLLALTEDLGTYIDVHKEILKLDFDIFIGGHLRRGTRRDVARNLRFTNDLVSAAEVGTTSITPEKLGAAGIGKFSDPSAVEFENVWYAFLGVFRKLEVDECYRIVLKKWGCRIGGLDFTLMSHCFIAIEYVTLDL